MGFKLNRRKFLKLVGASSFSAIINPSVAEPAGKLMPYLIPPFDIIPGVADWYTTVCRECPAGCGMLVRVREGRAVKVEGNPQHPVNRGRLCARGQASLQGLYNPDRIRQPLVRESTGNFQPINWDEAEELLTEKLKESLQSPDGETIAFISQLVTATQEELIREWMKALGSSKFLLHEVMRNFENLAKVIVFTGLIVGYAYLMEFFIAWYSSSPFEQSIFIYRAVGDYAIEFWIMVVFNSLLPLAFFFKKTRTNIASLLIISLLINVGMWFERYVMIVSSLAHDYIPFAWGVYSPSWVELSITFGSFCWFFLLFIVFIKFMPSVSMTEVKEQMKPPLRKIKSK